MTEWLQTTFLELSKVIPLEITAFVLAFVEEIIPPIPSFPLLMAIGGLAERQGDGFLTLINLAFISALGKTVGAVIVYFIVTRLEDAFIMRYGRFFGINSAQLEDLGKKISDGPVDYAILTLLRTLPFISSAIVTVGCALLKVPLKLFVFTTFVGSVIRDIFYIYLGYKGVQSLNFLIDNGYGDYIKYAVIIGFLGLMTYLYIRQRRKKNRVKAAIEDN